MRHYKIQTSRENYGKWEILYKCFFKYQPTDYGYFATQEDAAETLLTDYKGEGIIIHYENI